MVPALKPEFPPLLPHGLYPMDLGQLRNLCVDKFPGSATRNEIMTNLEEVIAKVQSVSLQTDVWVDGSFLTNKVDPEDSDIVVRVEGMYLRTTTTEQRIVLDWISGNLKASLLCDSYVHSYYPAGHANYNDGLWMQSYWIRQFGFTRSDPPQVKGIAVITTK